MISIHRLSVRTSWQFSIYGFPVLQWIFMIKMHSVTIHFCSFFLIFHASMSSLMHAILFLTCICNVAVHRFIAARKISMQIHFSFIEFIVLVVPCRLVFIENLKTFISACSPNCFAIQPKIIPKDKHFHMKLRTHRHIKSARDFLCLCKFSCLGENNED